MSNLTEPPNSNRNDLQEAGISPPSELTLMELGIDPEAVKSIKPNYKRTHYRAIINWLTNSKAQINTSYLEQIKGLRETFHHLCKVEAWETASKILFTRLNTPTNEELHNQLNIWGYYREQIYLYNQLIDKVNPNLNTILTNGIGRAYFYMGAFTKAINLFQRSLVLAKSTQDDRSQSHALRNIGAASHALGNYHEAIEFYQQSLVISKKTKNKLLESAALGNIGATYHLLGSYEKSIIVMILGFL